MDSEEYPYSTRHLPRSMSDHQVEDGLRRLRALELLVQVSMVLRCEERRPPTYRTFPGAVKQSYYSTFRCHPYSRAPGRAVRM